MAGNDKKVPRLKDLKTDLSSVNEELNDIATKMSNIVDLGSAFKINTDGIDDLSSKFSTVIKLNSAIGKALLDRAKNERDLGKTLAETSKKLDNSDKRHGKALDSYNRALAHKTAIEKAGLTISQKDLDIWKKRQKKAEDLGKDLAEQKKLYDEQKKQLEGIDGTWTVIGKIVANEILGAIDQLGKALTSLGIDSVFMSFKLVKGGVEKIYDLMQRTVKATGEFNEGLGGTTQELSQLQKEGWKMEGALRGLSDAGLGIGLKEIKEATSAFGFADKELSKFRTTAVLVGKSMGIGSTMAGEMARTFKLLGTKETDIAKSFTDISAAANKAGVPVADFSKEINASKNFLASFGRAGRKVFLEAAGFAKRLGISLSTLEKFTNMTDTFESSAEAAAKMNTVFGTSINALDLMLEQDPSKRLEMVRRSFKDQGKTFENMSRQERKFFAQTMQLSEEEAAAVLESGMSLDDYNKKKVKQAKTEADAQKEIQRGLLKTVSTLNNWSLTFDNITRAFMPLLKDLTDFLGITVKIDEKTGKTAAGWKSFAGRVEQVVGRIRTFFKMMGENENVQKLIATITNDFKDLFNAFTATGPEADKNMQKLVGTLGSAADIASKFYTFGKGIMEEVFTKENIENGLAMFRFLADNIGKITIGLLAVKGVLGAVTVVQGLASVVNLLTGAGGFMSALSALSGTLLGSAGLVAGVGAASYALTRFILKVSGGDDAIQKWMDYQMNAAEKVGDFFSDMFLGLKRSTLGQMIFGSGAGDMEAIRKSLGAQGINNETLELLSHQLMNAAKGRGGDISRTEDIRKNAKLFGEYIGQSEDAILRLVEKQQDKNRMLRQGRTASPQDTDFKSFPGTAIPASVATPANTTTTSAATPVTNAPVNFANKTTKTKTAAGNVTIVAGDVLLDGNLVGRHLGRLAYEG